LIVVTETLDGILFVLLHWIVDTTREHIMRVAAHAHVLIEPFKPVNMSVIGNVLFRT
jgi:hypothetical protein